MQVSGTLVSASATEIETPPSKPQNTDEPPPLANVIEACAYGHLHLPLGPLLGQGEDLQQSLTLAQYPYERAALWLQMGFSYSLRGRDPWKGFRTCQKAYLIAKDLGDIPLQTFALTYSYFSLGIVREFAQAAELWQEADKTIATFPHSELKTIHLMYSAKYMFQRGDTSISDRYLNEALGEIHNHGLLYLYPWSFMDLTFQKFYAGKYQEAEEVGKQLIDISASAGNPWMYAIALITLALCYYHKGDFFKAREWLVRGEEEGLTVGVLSGDQQSFRKVLLGVSSCHLQMISPDTEKELREALNHCIGTNNPYYKVQARFDLNRFPQ